MNSSFKIGHRTLKTVAAVFLCLLVNFLFGKKEPFYAVIAAILCIQPSIHKSMDIGIYRIVGTVLGSILCFFVLWAGKIIPYYSEFMYLLVIPVTILVFIYLLNILHLKDSVPVATITFIVMIFTLKPEINGTLAHAIERTLDTIVGAVIGVLVNRYMFRNDWRYTTDKLDEIDELDNMEAEETEDIIKMKKSEKLTKTTEAEEQPETIAETKAETEAQAQAETDIETDRPLTSRDAGELPPTIQEEELSSPVETNISSDAEDEELLKDVICEENTEKEA
ncbi:MAG: FUSC family protein [Lachnospiraceae bacterium]